MNPFLKQPPKAWVGVGIAPLKFKEKPKIITQQETGPDIFVPVVGLRSDGMEFTIDVAVDSVKLGQTSGPDAFMGTIQQLQIAFASLASYRDCSCRKDEDGKPIMCSEHQPKAPN
jgi:L-2-hydroxyglutarate oxidase LhgO